jgi:hypothetical protein
MQLHRISQVTNPETFEPMTIEIWRRWREDKPDYWAGETWAPSWELFAMSPNTQFELELN